MAATDWFSDFVGDLPTESTPIHDQVLADLAAADREDTTDTDCEVEQ